MLFLILEANNMESDSSSSEELTHSEKDIAHRTKRFRPNKSSLTSSKAMQQKRKRSPTLPSDTPKRRRLSSSSVISKNDRKEIESYFRGIADVMKEVDVAHKQALLEKVYCYRRKSSDLYYKIQKPTLQNKLDSDITLDYTSGTFIARLVEREVTINSEIRYINQTAANTSDSSGIIKALECLLKPIYFKELTAQVKNKGYWSLPEDLIASLPALKKFDRLNISAEDIPSIDECKSSKELFEHSKFMLECFCHLKIKELIHHLKNKQEVSALFPVKLCALTHQDDIFLTEGVVKFDSDNVFSITIVEPIYRRNSLVMDALSESSWFYQSQEFTTIRFSDMAVEDDITFRYFCSDKVDYGLLPEEVDKRANKSQPINFWENIAYKRKKKLIDWSEIIEFEEKLDFETGNQPVKLSSEINTLAAFRNDIVQKPHVEKIIKNQMLARGTLLHLPTGFGKTFILFMVMAHHREQLKGVAEQKPYLIVVHRKNVAQSWNDNFKRLAKISISDKSRNIFHIKKPAEISFKNLCDKTQNKADKFKLYCSDKEHTELAVAVTSSTLKNTVDNFFSSSLLFESSKSANVIKPFETVIDLLIESNIVTDKGYIIGNQKHWKHQIHNLIEKINATINQVVEFFQTDQEAQEKLISNKDPEDYFYPRASRRTGQDQVETGLLKKRLKIFISKFENKTNHYKTLIKSIRKLRNKQTTSSLDDKDFEFLFKCIHLFYKSQFLYKASSDEGIIDYKKIIKFEPNGEISLLKLLDDYKKRQSQSTQDYQQFKNIFAGIIIDESEQALVVSTNKSLKIDVTNILIDIARTYQLRSSIGSATNPLIVAASATPWPNTMNEFSLHMRFLLPRLIGDKYDLHKALFKKWQSFESVVSSACDNKYDEKMLGMQQVIEHHMQRWVRLLFRTAVTYQVPQLDATNFSTEEVEYIIYDQEIKSAAQVVNQEDSGNILSLIHNFYSEILEKTPIVLPNNKDAIFQRMQFEQKNAFYVYGHDDAVKLAMRITDFYLSKGYPVDTIQIGYFYDDTFVKHQGASDKKYAGYKNTYADGKKAYREYINVTYNTARRLNRNAFNNCVNIDDFFIYQDQYMGRKQDANWNKVFELLLVLINQNNDDKLPKLIESNFLQNQKTKKLIFPNNENYQAWVNLDKKDKNTVLERFVRFISKVLELERFSEENLIKDFMVELIKFKEFLPEKYQSKEPSQNVFYNFRTAYTEKYSKLETKKEKFLENGPFSNNPFDDFTHKFIHYMTKICQSNFFIFGEAGTSGMRIDADCLFVLSGAWTEGRLTQVKGRVGRAKGNDNRECKIYLPITNTLFEYLILKYYVKKAHIDTFITQNSLMSFAKIAEPLILSNVIHNFHQQVVTAAKGADHYLDNDIHNRVKKLIEKNKDYMKLGPYAKAIQLLPEHVLKGYRTIQQSLTAIESSPLPASIDRSGLLTSTAHQDVLEEQLRDACWGEEFSMWIKQYAISRGWDEKNNQYNAGSILCKLHPNTEMCIKVRWENTLELYDDEEILPETSTTEIKPYSPGIIEKEEKKSSVIPLPCTLKNNILNIDIKMLEQSFYPEYTTAVERVEAGKICRSYKIKPISISWPEEMPDEIVIELSSHVPQGTQINVAPLIINGKTYELYAQLLGGNHIRETHFWTHRRGKDHYYVIDDLKPYIQQINTSEFKVDEASTIFRFVEKTHLESLLSLAPKRLINNARNCYINAAFQCVDSEILRNDIQEFIDIHTQLPNSSQISPELYKFTKDSEITTHRQQPPKIMPYRAEEFEISTDQLSNFISKSLKQVILIMPTRGVSMKHYDNGRIDGDIELDRWLDNLNKLLKDSFLRDYQFIVIFGINCEFAANDDQAKLEQKLDKIIDPLMKRQEIYKNILIIPQPFFWSSVDRYKNKVPIGQMRNFCLEQASKIYHMLISNIDQKEEKEVEVGFLSMDGDTYLTIPALRHALDFSRCYRLTVRTTGYEMITINSNELAKKVREPQLKNEDWNLLWSQLISHISMEISSKLTPAIQHIKGVILENRYLHFGYCCEPLISVSPALTKKLFMKFNAKLNITSEYKAPFGFWDCEGRRFIRFLRDCANHKILAPIDVVGPSRKANERPLLRSYTRFLVEAPPHRKLKQQLTKDELAWVISNMTRQPQHLIKPWFTGSNISVALKMSLKHAHIFASYFYVKNFLMLLKLGPYRACKLSHYLHKRYLNEAYDDRQLLKDLKCPRDKFEAFINLNFFKTLSSAPEEEANKFRKYAIVLAFWSIIVTEELQKWFKETYIGEDDQHKGFIIPMALPEAYPREAFKTAREDEVYLDAKPKVKISDVVDAVNRYFTAKFDEDYNLQKRKLDQLRKHFNEEMILLLARVQGNPLVSINKAKFGEETDDYKKLFEKVNELLPYKAPIILSIDYDSNSEPDLKFITLDEGKLVECTNNNFSVKEILSYVERADSQILSEGSRSQATLLATQGLMAAPMDKSSDHSLETLRNSHHF